MPSSYVTPEQFLARRDIRAVQQLLPDGPPQGVVLPPVEAVTTHPVLIAALEDASGQVRAACETANRYTAEELDTLGAANDPFLIRLVCDLAFGLLLTRRSRPVEAGNYPEIERAEQWLALLRFGERVLNVQSAKDAGNEKGVGISAVTYAESGLAADQYAFFYPRGFGINRSSGRGCGC